MYPCFHLVFSSFILFFLYSHNSVNDSQLAKMETFIPDMSCNKNLLDRRFQIYLYGFCEWNFEFWVISWNWYFDNNCLFEIHKNPFAHIYLILNWLSSTISFFLVQNHLMLFKYQLSKKMLLRERRCCLFYAKL